MSTTTLHFILLTTLFIYHCASQSCTSISDDNKTCYITPTLPTPTTIICDSQYPNCVLTCAYYYCDDVKTVHCPSVTCSRCIINSDLYAEISNVTVQGYNCKLLQIQNSKIYNSVINAPGNGGSLEIIGSGHYKGNKIFSSNNGPGTQNMIFFTDNDDKIGSMEFSDNYIYGNSVAGDLNLSCYDLMSYCVNISIECGILAQCRINCAADRYNKMTGCNDITVNISNLSKHVFQCADASSFSCQNSRICCGKELNCSTLQWDIINGWYYDSPYCLKNWSEPELTCQFIASGKCIIIRDTYPPYQQSIRCPNLYDYCLLNLAGTPHSNGEYLEGVIHCPQTELCKSCIIHCNEQHACSGSLINGYQCQRLEIIIRAGKQQYITIFAPGNEGTLFVDVIFDPTQPQPGHEYQQGISMSNIHSMQGTTSMIFNFAQCVWCMDNIINGTFVTNYMDVYCDLFGNCNGMDITCPNDANCFIKCTGYDIMQLGYKCSRMTVSAAEGTHDVNWVCQNFTGGTGAGCSGSKLKCYAGTSEWKSDDWENGIWYLDPPICIQPPSESPTPSPTDATSAPTTSPTPPTAAPTASPLDIYEKLGFTTSQWYGMIAGIIIVVLLFVALVVFVYWKYKRLKQTREQSTNYIANPMVLSIGVAFYDEKIKNAGVNMHCPDLDGIKNDYENLKTLSNLLKWEIYPKHLKLQWTQDEIINFITEHAAKAEANIDTLNNGMTDPNKQVNGYDSIVMVLSGHGYRNNIITSDYQLISKTALHRLISTDYPLLREIPRIIIFDCCDGNQQRSSQPSDKSEKNVPIIDKGKNFSVDDIRRITSVWKRDQKNPDYRLALLHAANPGFQAKMNSIDGSYLIYEFAKRTIHNIEKDNKLFLGEIVHKIQNELHDRGKQQIEAVFNNDTWYLKFKRNDGWNEEIKEEDVDIITEQKEVENISDISVTEGKHAELELMTDPTNKVNCNDLVSDENTHLNAR